MTRRTVHAIVLSALLIAACGLLAGCSTRVARPATPEPPQPAVVEPTGEATDSGTAGVEELGAEPFREEALAVEEAAGEQLEALDADAWNARGVLAPVYFDFDSARLSDEALATLEANARWLREHPEFRVVVEGHCDERGTTEYNLNLGARRARSIRDHLVRLGVEPDRIETISYGEERPVDPGHTESAWARNRRGEFRLVAR